MNRYLRLFPLVLPLILLIVGYARPITALNQDLGRHLLTGKIIVQTLHVPSTNLFSYTYPDFPFINHHWFSEVIFYLLASIGGYQALFVLSLLLIIAAFGLVLFTAAKTAKIIPLTFLALIYLRVLFERTDLRPELFSFFFLALMITILYRYREKSTKLIFLLIPLQLLWSNMHIYFPIGILLTLLFTIEMVITKRKNLLDKQPVMLFITLGLMGVVTLINPHGLTGALYPFTVMQNYGYTIEENQNPFFLQTLGFSKPSFLYLEMGIVILFASLLFTLKRSRLIDWLLAIVFSIVALSAVRNFPLFVFATFIACSHGLSTLLEQLPSTKRHHLYKYSALILLFLFFCYQTKTISSTRPVGYAVYEDAKQALDFVKKEHVRGPLFNNFDIGSYIESRLYPTQKVFIDGRPEAYPATFIKDLYIPMQEDTSVFAKASNKYHFNTIIFSHTDQTPWAQQFISTIVHDKEWSTIYLDPTMIILVKNDAQNASLIKKFGLPESLPMTIPNDERLLRQAAHFYSITSSPEIIPILKRLTELNPRDCPTLQALTSLYIQEKDPAAQIYQQRYQNSCLQ